MKKLAYSLLSLLAIDAAAWFIFAPAWFEKQTNMVDGKPLPEIRAEAQALHDSLMIVDLHGDTLLWKRKITDSVDYGHIDLDRLQAGNIGLQVFSSVTKTPRGQNYDSNSADTDNITPLVISQLQPARTWFSRDPITASRSPCSSAVPGPGSNGSPPRRMRATTQPVFCRKRSSPSVRPVHSCCSTR